MPLSLKKTLAVNLLFQENESTLTETEKAKLLLTIERVRKEDWCPLETVVLIGYSSPTEGTPEQAQVLSSERVENVISLLHSFGLPKRSTYGQGMGANKPHGMENTPPSSRVEVEFIGMGGYGKCGMPKTNSGFNVR
jgi:outer membrane protein OmpA-like peptidoglycan-associated protein